MQSHFTEVSKILKKDRKKNGTNEAKLLCKLTEEVGELAQSVNKIIGMKGTSEPVSEIDNNISEEIADCIQILFTIGIMRNISYEDLTKMLAQKNIKYKNLDRIKPKPKKKK